MKLKKLELFGFKSFADHTEFDFDSGITAIVGPNGCGKSNVVDAVKWVLGEQSPKSLRGREMTDVIFAGSAARTGLGYAEATLTFANGDKSGKASLPTDAHEIEVSRRLHRSGECEYFLNRRPCRLKDIRELFMNTGLGVDAYSLIEQGKVDIILQGSPLDRRLIFEEAAGISKYKSKRKEAQRKLERAEQNLLRLTDIITEIQRRLRSIKYQAGKARSYRKYTERLKELRLSYALNEYHKFDGAHRMKAAEIASLRSQQSAENEKARQLGAEKAEHEASLAKLHEARQTDDEQLALLRGQMEKLESQIAFNRNQIADISESIRREGKKIADLTARKGQICQQLAAEKQLLGTLAAELETKGRQTEEANRQVAAAADEIHKISQTAERQKGELIDLLRVLGERRNQMNATEAELVTVDAQRERITRRRDQIASAVAEREEQIRSLQRQRDEAEQRRQANCRALEAKCDEANHLGEEVRRLADELARARELRSGLQSRRQLLQDLQTRGEGVNAAVRQVLQWNQSQQQPVCGMLADAIDVDIQYAPIIEAAIGERQQMLVFNRFADIERMIAEIGPALQGRVQCLALDAIVAQSDGRDISSLPGAVGWAKDLVRTEAEFQSLIECLLARTVVTRTIGDSKRLADGDLAGYRFVTEQQDVLEADGTVLTGPTAVDDSASPTGGLILRRSELQQVETNLSQAQTTIEELSRQYEAAAAQLKHLQAEQQALQDAGRELESAKLHADAELHHLVTLKQQLQAETPLIENELADLTECRKEALSRKEAIGQEIHGLETSCNEKEESIKSFAARQADAEQRRNALEEQRTHLQVALAQLEEKQSAAQSRCRDLEALVAGCVEGIQQGEEELARSKSRIIETEREILSSETDLTEAFAEREHLQKNAAKIALEEQATRASLAAISEQASAIEAIQDGLRSKIHAIELEVRELQTNRENLVVRIREDFAAELAELYENYHPEDIDWHAVEEEIKELRGKIERLGNVNLESIDEQDELQGRETFLLRQKEDLEKARAALGRLIHRIDEECQQKFLQTFQDVRVNFQDMFRKLFGGGRADIILEDELQPLECGIEVIAKPPGKELQRISLLSGGEKALSAVALLLSIFRAKPSPFCILDEVDATLDEANTERFASVICDFMDRSQFIVITHNKRTMAVADTLYGLTMQDAGVSRKISLQFSDIHADPSKRELVKA